MSDETPVVPVEQPVVPVEPEAPVVPESPAEPEKDWKAEAEKERQRAENYKREIEVKGLREKKDRNLPALTSTDGNSPKNSWSLSITTTSPSERMFFTN